MSVTDPAVELTICATDRELRHHFGKPRTAGWRETDRQDSTGVASTGTSDDSQMYMHCQPAVTMTIGAIGHHQTSWSMHRLALADMSFSGMFENRLYQYRHRQTRRHRMLYPHLAYRRYDYTAQSYTCCKSRITRVIYDLNHCAYKTAGYSCKFVYKTVSIQRSFVFAFGTPTPVVDIFSESINLVNKY